MRGAQDAVADIVQCGCPSHNSLRDKGLCDRRETERVSY